MPRHIPLIAVALAALMFSAQAATAPPPAGDAGTALVEQGRFWQTRSEARATEVWEKLLLLDPGNDEALASLGRLALAAKRMADAQSILARLRKVHPDSQLALLLEQEIAFSTEKAGADLDQAHILLREQKYDQAIAKYRLLFNNRVPQGKMALEFYTVLGYSKDGWQEAVTGLERLRRAAPDDAGIQLELANVQLLRNQTRTQALRTLALLSKRSDVGGDATEHWRSALGWMGAPPPPSMVPFFQEYLRANPDDKDIRAQLNARPKPGVAIATGAPRSQRIDPLSQRVLAGFAALKAEDLPQAETEFRAALKLKARNPSALGGLGLVRLRQKDFAQARDLLTQASKLGDAASWSESLASATYWDLVQKAEAARGAGRAEDARLLLEQALQVDAREASGANALAAVYGELGRPAEAERAWRDVLARQPDNIDALRGLVSTLGAAGRTAEALAVIDALDADQRARIDVRSLRATQYLAEYRDALARKDFPVARARLEDAVAQSPDEPWIRLDLARLYLRQDRAEAEARSLMADLLARRPQDPEVRYANALLRAELREWPAVLDLLQQIAKADLSRDMTALQRRAELQVAIASARDLVRAGRTQEASALLGQAASRMDGDAEGLGLVAQGYVEAGDNARALALLRGAQARGDASVALRLQYADVLLRTGQEAELAGLLRELQATALDEDGQRQFNGVKRGYVLRRAEALRLRKDSAGAYALMQPLLAETPDDPALLGLLARLYADAGQPAQAGLLYRQVLAATPDDTGALLSAGIIAAGQGEYAYAEQVLNRARQLEPRNADVLAALGRLFRMQGRNTEALPLLKAAVAALSPAPQPSLQGAAGVGGSPLPALPPFGLPDNPFAVAPRPVLPAVPAVLRPARAAW